MVVKKSIQLTKCYLIQLSALRLLAKLRSCFDYLPLLRGGRGCVKYINYMYSLADVSHTPLNPLSRGEFGKSNCMKRGKNGINFEELSLLIKWAEMNLFAPIMHPARFVAT